MRLPAYVRKWCLHLNPEKGSLVASDFGVFYLQTK
jgi:hypothetical protein